MRQRNEPKNLRICSRKKWCAHLSNFYVPATRIFHVDAMFLKDLDKVVSTYV
jgi:hypothetical protein